MRAELLERMKHLGIDAYEADIDRKRLLAANECFLSNAVIGIWPVNKIEKKSFQIGKVTRRLIVQLEKDQESLNEHTG